MFDGPLSTGGIILVVAIAGLIANTVFSLTLINPSPFGSIDKLKSKKYSSSFWTSAKKRGEIEIFPLLAETDSYIDAHCIHLGKGGFIKPDKQLYSYSVTVLEGSIKALKDGQIFVELGVDDTIRVDRLEDFGFRTIEPATVLTIVTTELKMTPY